MVAADIAADPNTITDPTGGVRNFNLLDVFQEFGYQPTQAEINSLSASFAGSYNMGEIGTNAIAQYVNYKNQQAEFEKNDPLNAVIQRSNDIFDKNMASVKGLSQQLQDTLTSAPKLFGSLTPDQIADYLKPLQATFKTQMDQVQGTLASRGLGASSTEANALAQTNQQFQETVLSTGLNIGLDAQKNQANSIEAMINNLFTQSGQALGVGGQAAGQKSAQALAQSNLIASLPSFLNSQSAMEQQIAAAQEKARHPGFQGTFNQVTSDINTGINTFSNLMSLGKDVSTPYGGIKNSAPGGGTPPVPAGGGSPSTSLYQGSAGTPAAYGLDPNQNALFQNTGSMFGS